MSPDFVGGRLVVIFSNAAVVVALGSSMIGGEEWSIGVSNEKYLSVLD